MSFPWEKAVKGIRRKEAKEIIEPLLQYVQTLTIENTALKNRLNKQKQDRIIQTLQAKIESLNKFTLLRLSENEWQNFEAIEKGKNIHIQLSQTEWGLAVSVQDKDGNWQPVSEFPE